MLHDFFCVWNSLFSFSALVFHVELNSCPLCFRGLFLHSDSVLNNDHSRSRCFLGGFLRGGIRFTTFSLSKLMLSDIQNSSQNVQEHWRCEVEWLVNDTSGTQLKLQICVVLPVHPVFLWVAQQSLGNRKSAGKGSQCDAIWTVLYCNLFLKS